MIRQEEAKARQQLKAPAKAQQQLKVQVTSPAEGSHVVRQEEVRKGDIRSEELSKRLREQVICPEMT